MEWNRSAIGFRRNAGFVAYLIRDRKPHVVDTGANWKRTRCPSYRPAQCHRERARRRRRRKPVEVKGKEGKEIRENYGARAKKAGSHVRRSRDKLNSP